MSDLIQRGMSPGSSPPQPPEVAGERELARRRVERQSKVRADLLAYVVINAFLIGIWALGGFGYFWPGWVLAGWAVLLLLDVWNAYVRRPVTEADVDRELQRHR